MVLRPNDFTVLKLAGLGPGNVPYPQIMPISMFGGDEGLTSADVSPATADKFITIDDIFGGSGRVPAAAAPQAISPTRIPGLSPAVPGYDVPMGGSWLDQPTPPPASIEGGPSYTWPGIDWLFPKGGIGGPGGTISPEQAPYMGPPQPDLTENPAYSKLHNMAIAGVNVIGSGINTGVQSAKDMAQWLETLAMKPEGEYDTNYGSGTDVPKLPAVAPTDIFGPTVGTGPGGTGTGTPVPTEIPMGHRFIPEAPPTIAPIQFPMPPKLAAPTPRPEITPFDPQPYLDKLKQYEPQDINRQDYMQEHLLANLSRAFAAGAGGSGWSGGTGALARFGAGFGTSQADTTEQYIEKQAGVDEAQRQFGIDSVQMEMQLKQQAAQVLAQNAQTRWQSGEDVRQTDMQNQANEYEVLSKNISATNEANQTNADRMYEYHNTVGQMTQDTVLPGTGKGTIAIQSVDPQGNASVKIYNYDNPNFGYTDSQLDTMKKMHDIGILDGSPQMNAVKYGPKFASNDKGGIQQLMAEEAVNGHYAEMLLPEDQLQEAKDETETELGERKIMPGSTGYDEAYNSTLAAHMMMKFDIFSMDPNQLQALAARGNYGAGMIWSMYAKKQAEQGPGAVMPGGIGGPH